MKQDRDFGSVVPGKSAIYLDRQAETIRNALGYKINQKFDVVQAYDVMTELVTGFEYELLPSSQMGSDMARTFPDKRLIQVDENVYRQACNDNGMARFTLCHELGHLFLHTGISFQRSNGNHKIFESSEWQADVFAGAMLCPLDADIDGMVVQAISEQFGMSHSAVLARLRTIEKIKQKRQTP